MFLVRKKSSGQVFAAKLWNNANTPRVDLTNLAVLSELSALLKVNDGWHACDELDRGWCPIVQLHGLFLRPRGLLIEKVRLQPSAQRSRKTDQTAALVRSTASRCMQCCGTPTSAPVSTTTAEWSFSRT